MSYAVAIDQLSAMTPELYTQPGQTRRKFSLAEIGALLAVLGDPHRRFPSVLIAGTNGKGSTASTLASICGASGLLTGLYTSPHLTRPNERIRISGNEIADDDFAHLYFCVHDRGRQLVLDKQLAQLPSFFETLTAMAFLYFAEMSVDIAVLEVGMGGRLDATNIVDPLLSIVTDISLDHTEWLGPTISAIAREKAGILRPNGTLIILPQHPEANQILGEVATELSVRAVSAVPYMPPQLPFKSNSERSPLQSIRSLRAMSKGSLLLEDGDASPAENAAGIAGVSAPEVHPYAVEALGAHIQVASPLQGEHQQRNVALAIAAGVELATNHRLPITAASIEQGIRATCWPGRLERIFVSTQDREVSAAQQAAASFAAESGQSVPTQWVLDVAHNPAGAWALRAALRTLFCLGEPGAPHATLVFGCLRDKPLLEMAQILFPLFDQVVFASIHSIRSTPLADLLAAAETVGVPASAASSVSEALLLAESFAGVISRPTHGAAVIKDAEDAVSGHDVCCVDKTVKSQGASALRVAAGSVYLVGEIRPLLLARAGSKPVAA